MKIAVIGAGSWGTALAQCAAKNNHDVCMWARKQSVVDAINNDHVNSRYLSDVPLSEKISATTSYAEAFADAAAAVIVTPSATLRETALAIESYAAKDLPMVLCSKGVEAGTGMVGVEVFADILGNESRLAALSGPNHAEEVVLGIPAATVIASSCQETAEFFQGVFASASFRTYISDDVLGVELCAAFKNVIAIATGASYGYGFGDNTAAALQTRGLAEMSRLVAACGGQTMTCLGLAGAGDLIATCMSRHSRNRKLGEMLAQGKTLEDFTAETHMVAEGAVACETLSELAERIGVDLPIALVVRGLMRGETTIEEAVAVLNARPLKAEFY